MKNRPLEVSGVDADTRERWKQAARDAGLSLSELVRQTMNDAVGSTGKLTRKPKRRGPTIHTPDRTEAPPPGGKRTYEPDFKKGSG